jgi:hypothetical protein
MAGTRRKKAQLQPFDFMYKGKNYVIRAKYHAQPATIFTTDGNILYVQVWQLGIPVVAVPEHVETFDPKQITAADRAAVTVDGFVAELVQPASVDTQTQ